MEREYMFRRLLESIDDVVWQIDLQGRLTYVSPSVERLYGYKPEEMIGRSYLEFTPSELHEDSLETFQLLMEKGELRGYETAGISKSGDTIHIVINISSVRDDDGNITGFQGITHDITQRKKIEMELKKNEEKYRSLVETSQDLIWKCDEEGRFTYLNPAWERSLGYRVEEMLGRRFTEFQTPEVSKRDIEEFMRHLEGGEVYGYETTHISKSGETVHLIFNAIPLTDGGDKIVGTQGTAYDITHRKQMEEELLKSRKLESLGIMAGGIAHDFNNILTAVIGNVGTLKNQTNPDDNAYEKLVQTEKAIFRAKNLTSQLLTFARGGSPIKKTVSIGDIIKELVEFVLSGSNVKCEFLIPEDLWPVELDEGQFSQVINNLVLNADQAMPEGGTIKITCRNVPEGDESFMTRRDDRCKGNYVKISISDKGVGIQKEHLGKIFDPYFTTKQRGGGLGLATAYSIVDRHGGMIVAESTPGEGTTFHICLPATDKVPETRNHNEGIMKGEGRVLLMDDEDIVRASVSSMLGSIGYRVDTATDGGEAVEKYREAIESHTPYDAVILDLTVPGGMGGKKTIVKLKEIDPHVKAIVSSGYSHDPVMANYEKYGFSGVLSKPFRLVDLSKVLQNILSEE